MPQQLVFSDYQDRISIHWEYGSPSPSPRLAIIRDRKGAEKVVIILTTNEARQLIAALTSVIKEVEKG